MKSSTTLIFIALFTSTAIAQTSPNAVLKNLKFRSIGPATMGGRIDDLAVVESDPRIIYVGAAAGGIFKTVNGGNTWQPIFDDQPNPSIGDLALAPSNPSILYVGTGEANNRQSSSWGNGVYKSMDAGATWTHLGLQDTRHIGRIVVHPTNPNIVYTCAVGRGTGPQQERGVFKSTDGGTTWTPSLFVNADTGCSALSMDANDPNTLVAGAWQLLQRTWQEYSGGPSSGAARMNSTSLKSACNRSRKSCKSRRTCTPAERK